MKTKPVAVVINDVHYDRDTLEVADTCMNMAIDKANELGVMLLVPGDLHNSKAILRAECVNRMIKTFKRCNSPATIVVGNHCKINEKSEEHALEFLRPYASVVDWMTSSPLHNIGYLIPYQYDMVKLRNHLKTLPKGSQVIMHQGLQGSNSGEYYRDPTALNYEDVAGLKVISGHYHYRGTYDLPEVGSWTYTGNPYTLNFGEANDPEKGFHILYSDGSLEFVHTHQRRHVIFNLDVAKGYLAPYPDKNDLLWVKVTGTKAECAKVTKESIRNHLGLDDFRLDYIFTDDEITLPTKSLANGELLDSLIDSSSNEDGAKELKSLWRKLLESP